MLTTYVPFSTLLLATLRLLDKAPVDKLLWTQMLKGRMARGSSRHTQAHCIKFANALHISLDSLDKRNPEWFAFRSQTAPTLPRL